MTASVYTGFGFVRARVPTQASAPPSQPAKPITNSQGLNEAPPTRVGKTHIYGKLYSHMKTTVDLPDDLVIAAKKKAAEERLTLKVLIERGLRGQLAARTRPSHHAPIRWVTVDGRLPADLPLEDREAMRAWLARR